MAVHAADEVEVVLEGAEPDLTPVFVHFGGIFEVADDPLVAAGGGLGAVALLFSGSDGDSVVEVGEVLGIHFALSEQGLHELEAVGLEGAVAVGVLDE